MDIAVVDLFCGIGGLSQGFTDKGIKVLAGIDNDKTCKYAYEENIKADFIEADVSKITGSELDKIFSRSGAKYKVLVGCAPCPPFSTYTGRYRKLKQRDPRRNLINEFARLIRDIKPDVISMENVPQLSEHPIFKNFVKSLESEGYIVNWGRVWTDQYGVPQKRSRLVLLASRWGEIKIPEPTHLNSPVTVREVIGGLPKIEAGESSKDDAIHSARALSSLNLRRIKSTKEGGSWTDWPESLQLACHKKASGQTFRSVYGRMKWDAPSPVITTQCLGIGNGRFGHPEQNRAISIREAALLQSFPKDFKFVPPGAKINKHMLARHIGNAVPVKLGQVIATAIKEHLQGLPKKD